MTHPLFKKEIFVETAFARRFQKMLQDAWDNRSWHLLVADPGAGKTMSIRDLQKRAGGRSVLAVVAPKNNDDEQALGDQFLAALGLPIRGHWSTRPVLDPTRSGRVTMDNLMKLVVTALEWSYLDGKTDVAPSRLKSAAELLVLRHDTLKLSDGAGPTTLAQDQTSAEEPGVNGKEPERQTAPEKEQQNTTKTVEPAKEQEI